ncbi:MAG: TetR family transcriptional regulator [Solirubrobacteraceae bacterium]|nr:TetR family transcriptional regulator [Solirubrobacteraceae bacterium]
MATRPASHRARGLARREALLRAAVEIVAERGVGGATHRAIAERAEVPPSTTTYFFASIDELILEALRHFTTLRVQQLQELGGVLKEQGSEPAQIARTFAEILCAAPLQHEVAQFEAYLDASRREPDEQGVVAGVLEAFEGVAIKALEAVGTPNPQQVAPLFVALADGYGLRRIALGHSLDPAPLADAFHRLFLSYRDAPPGTSLPG